MGSFKRAGLAAAFMLIFLIVIEKGTIAHKLATAGFVAVFATLLYAPAGYYLELWMYRRRMAKQGTSVKR